MSKRSLLYILIIATMILTACTPAAPPVAPTTAPAQEEVKPTEAPVVEEVKPTEAPAVEEVKPTEAPVVEEVMTYTEAPMLADMVKAGTLPPIEERLPENPFVVGPGVYMTEENLPDWQPGKYGGTLRSTHSVANWNPDIFVAMNEPFLIGPQDRRPGHPMLRLRELRGFGRQQSLHLHPAQEPQVVGRRAGDHRGRALRL